MVERPLSMREVPGSIPGFSKGALLHFSDIFPCCFVPFICFHSFLSFLSEAQGGDPRWLFCSFRENGPLCLFFSLKQMSKDHVITLLNHLPSVIIFVFQSICLFVFLLKGLTRHRRWCSTRYRDMDHAKSLNLLNHSNFADKFPKGGMLWGISSNGRAPALHAGSTGIDTRILQDHDFCNNGNKFLVFCYFFAVLFCSFT